MNLLLCIYIVSFVVKSLWGQKAYPVIPRLRNQNFNIKQIAFNRVSTLPDCRSRSQLSESGLRSRKGTLGVEL